MNSKLRRGSLSIQESPLQSAVDSFKNTKLNCIDESFPYFTVENCSYSLRHLTLFS